MVGIEPNAALTNESATIQPTPLNIKRMAKLKKNVPQYPAAASLIIRALMIAIIKINTKFPVSITTIGISLKPK